MRYVVPARTAWCDRFFDAMAPATGEEILTRVARLRGAVPRPGLLNDLSRRGMSGWSYWTLFVRGYVLYDERGQVRSDDPYLRYLGARFRREEPAEGPTGLLLATLRYRDCDLARSIAAGGPGAIDDFDPVIVVPGEERGRESRLVFDADRGTFVHATAIYGYHRLFAGRLFGLDRLPCRVMEHVG